MTDTRTMYKLEIVLFFKHFKCIALMSLQCAVFVVFTVKPNFQTEIGGQKVPIRNKWNKRF